MGADKSFLLMVFLAIVAIIDVVTANPRCPPSSRLPAKPACLQDHDCRTGICCPNGYGKKSCTDPLPYNMKGYDIKYGGPGVYCNGVKCMPYESCKHDPYTKKLRCQK